MTAERQLQSSAHAHAGDRGDDRFDAAFNRADDRHQMRLRRRLRSSEFTDIRAPGKSGARTDEHNGLDGGVRIRSINAINDEFA